MGSQENLNFSGCIKGVKRIGLTGCLRGAKPLSISCLPLPLDKGKGIKGIGLPNRNLKGGEVQKV